MGEVRVVRKPSRSDDVLEEDEQIKLAEQIRAHFDSLAPKRPSKPKRSENGYDYSTPEGPISGYGLQDPPELHKFKAFQSQSQSQPIYLERKEFLDHEEFVETQYYKELNSIDKQHHTTGKGFITVAEGGVGLGFGVQQKQRGDGWGLKVMGLRSNPATNEWIPRVEGEEAIFVSSKPNRSEN